MKIINAVGQNCPMPVIMAKKEIDNVEDFFIIVVDNKIAVENLKKLANSQGFKITVKEENNIYNITFNNSCEECESIISKIQRKNLGNWATFIGKDIIGYGDKELGKSLIKMFFYTLAESDDIPKYILFMNDGVKVPTLNEQAIEHLKELQKLGVNILVCGTCLSFYGLDNKLSVGAVSNMYEIISAMKEVEKVISL